MDFKKQIEENIKRNKEREEAKKLKLEEKNKNKIYYKKVSEEREKKMKEREEKEKKEKEEQQKQKNEEEKKKKLDAQKAKEKQEQDKKKLEEKLESFRKQFGLNNEKQWSQKNWQDKKKYWEELGLKEEDFRRKIQLKNNEQKKKEILHEHYISQNKNSNSQTNDYNTIKSEDMKKQKKLIEDMCIIGDIIKNEIIEEKNNKENYISIEEAVKKEDKNDSDFILGLLATNFEKMGIMTMIEKESQKEMNEEEEKEKKEESSTLLQFITNGLATKKKYDFHFDISQERNEELLTNEEEQKKFIDKLRKKLSKEYNIKEDLIIITNPQRGSFRLTVIFQSDDFNLKKEELLEKFKDEPELLKLKEIHTGFLLDACKISRNLLDNRGNNTDGGWGLNETRGGEDYIPPEGWKGYGLNFMDKYDHGNNDWLEYDNREGEWCIAYRPIKNDKAINTAKINIAKIITSDFSKEENDKDEDEDEEDYSENLDIRHPGQNNFVGKGVSCYQNPKIMDEYCGEISVNNEKYKVGFMLRVNPTKIRMCAENTDIWVLNGNSDEIRPYRILVKKVD